LLVSEVVGTVDEYVQFVACASDESKGKLRLIHHASFNTLADNIRAVQGAERNGADLVLLSYPTNFFPETGDEIFEYTKAFAAATNLGIMLFPVPLWGFERIHPAGIPPSTIRRIVAEIPNIVAIKAEGGMPTIAGFVECWKTLSDKVIVTFPVESEGLPLAIMTGMQFMGTSNSEYYGPIVPKIFGLIQDGQLEKAMELYWQIHPARMANNAVNGASAGAHLVHRMLWKYQGWLNGFNGGSLRQPTMKITGKEMKTLRDALKASGLEPTSSPDRDFFAGRNPA
jgi:4-hydroxy-tetrahydrodipicolinate synthase